MTDLVLSQLTDLFRIGLLIGLVYTMQRTAAVTGRVLPLALGVVFVAVIVPSTLPQPHVPLMDSIFSGLIANTIILAPVLLAAALMARWRR
jgi:hypothetical protein